MENRFKASVVVAAYNAQKSIPKCVDSLLRQTLRGVEVILVDDGSKDGTGAVCDGYAGRHSNVVSLHRRNGGCGVARNTGADAARGEYIGFADADDWVEPDMYEKLYGAASSLGADIAMCDYFRERGARRDTKPRIDAEFVRAKVFSKDTPGFAPSKNSFFGTVVCWNKIFKRSFYARNIRFPCGLHLAEDVPAVFKALSRAGRICAVDEKLYHYRAEGASNSRVYDGRALDVFKAAGILLDDMAKNDYGAFKDFVVRSVANDALHHFKSIGGSFRREYHARFMEFAERLEKQGLLGCLGGKDAFKVKCFRSLGPRASSIIAKI
jgi:glycosyltransferase involved in cell wall biosynthesis